MYHTPPHKLCRHGCCCLGNCPKSKGGVGFMSLCVCLCVHGEENVFSFHSESEIFIVKPRWVKKYLTGGKFSPNFIVFYSVCKMQLKSK